MVLCLGHRCGECRTAPRHFLGPHESGGAPARVNLVIRTWQGSHMAGVAPARTTGFCMFSHFESSRGSRIYDTITRANAGNRHEREPNPVPFDRAVPVIHSGLKRAHFLRVLSLRTLPSRARGQGFPGDWGRSTPFLWLDKLDKLPEKPAFAGFFQRIPRMYRERNG